MIYHIESRGGDWSRFRLFSYSQARDIIKQVYPEAEITATLWAPVTYGANKQSGQIKGRSGGLNTWYLMPPLMSGTALGTDNLHEKVFMTDIGQVGTSISTRVATYQATETRETWQLAGTEEQWLEIIGRVGYPSPGGIGMGHLGVVQKISNTPEDLVHIVGVALPGLQANVGNRISDLRARLEAEMPVKVTSIDEAYFTNNYALDQLRKAAGLYTPILLIIALQVVIATALAVVHSRRRELSLLRIIGFSKRKVWLLFTLECTLSALTACIVGYVLSALVALTIFQSANISILPFVLALLSAVLVSMVVSKWAVDRSIPSVLRNS